MREPNQMVPFESEHSPNELNAIYVPPERLVMKEFAHLACVDLKGKKAIRSRQVIANGLADFLDFVAHRSAKYLNGGHRLYLLDGYVKPKKNEVRGRR